MSEVDRERTRLRTIAQALMGPHGAELGLRAQAARALLDCALEHLPAGVTPERRCRGCGAPLAATSGPGRPREWCARASCQRRRRDGETRRNWRMNA